MLLSGLDIKDFNVHGFDLRGHTNGRFATTCAFCSAERKKKNQRCCTVDLDKFWYSCSHCGKQGQLHTYKRKSEISYKKPVLSAKTNLSDKVLGFFKSRLISARTLEKMHITESTEWMPKAKCDTLTINFNYFRNSELINIKYRGADKDFRLAKDCELIMYNLDNIKDTDECIIVEGEMDCLAMVEAGYINTVSVPNGATEKQNNLSYIDNCYEYFLNKKLIYIAVDNDLAGRQLRNDLAERFGKDICKYIDFECFENTVKDANQCLIEYGIEGIIKAKIHAKDFPIEGVFDVNYFEQDMLDMYHNGLDRGVNLNIEGFDLNIVKGYLTTITGIPSHGKSEFLDNIIVHLRRYSNWKGAYFSPENQPTKLHLSKLSRKLIGKSFDGDTRMSEDELLLAMNYMSGYFYFIEPEDDFTLKSILESIKRTHLRYGIDWYVIDAWNKLDHSYQSGMTETQHISKSLDDIIRFNKVYNLHCFLVAHPTKVPKDKSTGEYEIPNLYMINGSSHFYNKTDNGITVYRDFKQDKSMIFRQKVKFDHWGTVGMSEYYFDKKTLRYNTSNIYDRSNWITGKKMSLADELSQEFNIY